MLLTHGRQPSSKLCVVAVPGIVQRLERAKCLAEGGQELARARLVCLCTSSEWAKRIEEKSGDGMATG